MERYPAYKPSGVEWIGEIPEQWEKGRIKNLVNNSKYYQIGDGDHGSIKPEMYNEFGIPYIRVQNLSWSGQIRKEGLVYISEEVHQNNLKSRLILGDILIAKTGATIGKLGLINEDLGESNTTSSVGKITLNKERHLPQFFTFFFQANFFQKVLWITSIEKSAQPGFNIDDLVGFPVLIPSLSEQHQIVEFLNKKTGLIDKLISIKERKITLLKEKRTALINQVVTKGLDPNVKMKDSGVEWIGEIPEHWNFVKTSILAQILDGKRVPLNSEERGEMEGVYPYWGSNGIVDYVNKFIFYEEIVLVGEDGSPFFDKLKDVSFYVNDAVWVNNHIHVLKSNNKILPKFLTHSFNCVDFKEFISGSTRDKLTQSDLKRISHCVPPLQEQHQIVEYLDTHTKKIDDLVSMEQKKIDLLKEYRQSLISEVVTGKIKVTND